MIQRRRKAARWTVQDRRWRRADATAPLISFDKYNVKAEIPEYDEETYEKHLTNEDWSKEETDYLVSLYQDCNGKWPVVWDHYEYEGKERTMEALKARFYHLSAQMLQLQTPIASMGATDFALYNTLNSFNAAKEESRKHLAEGHLYRKANEVDEETVLLGELQRIMVNQATLDNQREDLRKRLDYPHTSTSGYQYTTSQALTQLWQQLVAQDRLRKNPRLKQTGNPTFDGIQNGIQPPTTGSSRPRDSIGGLSEAGGTSSNRRPGRDSLPGSGATPTTATSSTSPLDLSKTDMLRFGVVVAEPNQKFSSGVTFASDRLSKPRIAKSTIQTEKIGAILTSIGVPDLIALPTPAVVDAFDQIMQKVHALLDLRKIAEKEEQELKIRSAESAS